MDGVPFDFRERVAALWKCCMFCCVDANSRCKSSTVPDCDWNQKSKKIETFFYITQDGGQWKYCFSNPDCAEGAKRLLSMDELKKYPNVKNITIRNISLTQKRGGPELLPPHATMREDLERLFKFVLFLSNKPMAWLDMQTVESLHSTEGATILNVLSTITFSEISITNYYAVYNQIVENQFSRRIAKPSIFVANIGVCGTFFQEHLINGNIKKFEIGLQFYFPSEVMQAIINGFLENPENYDEDQFEIIALFEESSKRFLHEQIEGGRCILEPDGNFCFKVFNPKLEKHQTLCIKYELLSGDEKVSMTIR